MPKIKVLEGVVKYGDGALAVVGSEIDVSDADAAILVAAGDAKLVETKKPAPAVKPDVKPEVKP